MSKIPRKNLVHCYILHNDQDIEDLNILKYQLHHEAYKNLRNFKTPQYDIAYLLRNAHGFNTVGFHINYDVVIANKNSKVIYTKTNIEPGYISKYFDQGYYIYFLVVGTINHYNIDHKDIFRVTRRFNRYLKHPFI